MRRGRSAGIPQHDQGRGKQSKQLENMGVATHSAGDRRGQGGGWSWLGARAAPPLLSSQAASAGDGGTREGRRVWWATVRRAVRRGRGCAAARLLRSCKACRMARSVHLNERDTRGASTCCSAESAPGTTTRPGCAARANTGNGSGLPATSARRGKAPPVAIGGWGSLP